MNKKACHGTQVKLKNSIILGGGCLKHISDTKDLLLAEAFKIHVSIVFKLYCQAYVHVREGVGQTDRNIVYQRKARVSCVSKEPF